MNDSLSQVLCVSSALRIIQHDSRRKCQQPAAQNQPRDSPQRTPRSQSGGPLQPSSRLDHLQIGLEPHTSFKKAFCRRHSVDVKALRPFCAVLKRGFDSPTISCFGHCERVLWTETLSQASRATLKETRKIDTNNYSYDQGDRDCYCAHVIDLPLVKA